jgi:endonuclease G
VQATRSVGRIETRLTGGRRSYGTGFLVSARLLLTNNHVLPTRTQAASSIVEFDYQLDFRDQPLTIERFELEPQAFYLTNRGLDFTLVAVKPTSLTGRLLEEYGWCPLIKEEGKIRITEPVNIVQHPRGEMKQVVIRENKLLDLLDPQPRAHYAADTERGSSGSPVFNDRWEVIALHHSGVPATDPEGNKLDVDGNIWQEGDDPDGLKWAANEGIRVSRLVRFVEQAEVQPHEFALKAALLAASQPPRVGRPGLTRVGVGDDAPVMPAVASSAPNAVSITVPLQITVSPGAATAPSGEADLGQPELEAIQPDPDYENRPGYKKDFLGFDVPLPDLGDAIAGQAGWSTAPQDASRLSITTSA